jgi:hypothetical protein
VRANPDDRVVVNEVPIGGRVGLLIRFFVASFFYGRLKRGCRVLESGAQDRRRAPLFLFRSLSCAVVNDNVPNRNCMPIVDPQCHEFTRMNLNASPLPDAPLSMSGRQIFGVGSEGTQVDEINLT